MVPKHLGTKQCFIGCQLKLSCYICAYVFLFPSEIVFFAMLMKAMVKRALNITEEKTIISKTLQCLDVRIERSRRCDHFTIIAQLYC